MASKSNKAKADLLATIRDRHKKAVDSDRENRAAFVEDMKFLHVPGEQWEEWLKTERGVTANGSGGRPCYEFNKLRISVKRLINDIRSNRPAGHVLGAEEGDKDTANVLEGLIRNICNLSDFDTVTDQAAEYQVGGGMGCWRVSTKYTSDSAWDQDIVIEGFDNPLVVYADPSARDPMKRDAQYWFVTTKLSKEAFEDAYPKAEAVSFENDNEFDDDDDWEDEESVRLVEYWYKEPYTKTLVLLSDGRTVDAEELAKEGLPGPSMNPETGEVTPPVMVLKTRDVQANRIKMCVASGKAVLKEADWAGVHFPFVMVYGESMVVDGKRMWFGAVRHSKDAQRAYNYSRTSVIESIALAPQAKFWATPAQAQGHTDKWKEAHSKLYPFLLYNADPATGGAAPQRMGGADVPVAMIQEVQMSSEDIKGTIGIFDASLGNRSNETSGIAIRSRQAQSELANFNFGDNMGKAIRRTWEILIDLIPKIYDTERSIRILGQDGAEKFAKVNSVDPQTGESLNDLSRGKYDVTVKIGPSFSTQREQAAEIYMGMVQGDKTGMLFTAAGDLIFKSTDLPYSDEIAKRLQAMQPPQIQALEQDGKPVPPEVAQAMAQANQAMQQVQMVAQQMDQDSAQIEQSAKDLEAQKAEIQRMISDLKVQQANLKVAEANLKAEVAQASADLSMREAQLNASGEVQQVRGEHMQAQAEMGGQQVAAQMVQDALQAVSEQLKTLDQRMGQQQQQPIVIAGGNRVKAIKRVNGGFQPEYED